MIKEFFKTKAHEFKGIEGWINSKELRMNELKGKVVLLDFWTYSCVNCIRTLPHLKLIWGKYKKYPFVLIGVHTPEFDFERIAANVEKAVRKHGISYPVALDSGNETWIAYGNQYWPRQALVDANGKIVWEHSGEGGYGEMEQEIVNELKKTGVKVEFKGKEEEARSYSYGVSHETYCGSRRNSGIGSSGVCIPGGCVYRDVNEHKRDAIYLEGMWEQKEEYLEFVKGKGYLAFVYNAKEVNLVMDGKAEVEVLVDGKSVNEKVKGKDVKVKGKKTIVTVDRADMYNLVKSKEVEEHEIKIVPQKGLRCYAFTFG